MKKYFEVKPSLDDWKDRMVILQDRDNKKGIFALIAIAVAVLALAAVAVVYLMKTKMQDEYDEDWDYDWDDLDDECFDDECDDETCCCTDRDVDDSVKVEQV